MTSERFDNVRIIRVLIVIKHAFDNSGLPTPTFPTYYEVHFVLDG